MSDSSGPEAEISTLYEEILERQGRLTELLRARGPEPVRKDYVFRGPDGEVRLSDLFGDKDDLLVVHNMGRGCPYCTLWADGFQGVLPHLEDRAAFVVISPDAPDVQAAFARSRGWTFRMASGGESSFAADMGYVTEHEGKPFMLPGYSTFRRREDGSIVRIAHSPFGPGDPYCAVWHLFALFEGGVGDWQPRLTY